MDQIHSLTRYLVASLSSVGVEGTDGARRALQLRPQVTKFQYSIAGPERCIYPVIAAVHGVAYGLAIDILSACDVRYAASDAIFSIKVRGTPTVCCCF